ncbi:hypothetical protein GACE_2272 [Geoglobus acetivorans]|uniref:Uncharacterized protein n=1 Tax=Geoglobus acetivorans TaxID=565033 RepID=A0A0A7GBY3_GEOAI|nr:hypothetical protein GACE_2272 [Geoglobus acetivorans]
MCIEYPLKNNMVKSRTFWKIQGGIKTEIRLTGRPPPYTGAVNP